MDAGDNPYFQEYLALRDNLEAPRGIVNGVETTAHPEVVALGADLYGGIEVFCSGTLIHPRWVLTAAHCLDNVEGMFGPISSLKIIFGGAVSENGGDDQIGWAEYHMHPSYSGQVFANDIGLVKLAEAKNDVAPMVVNDELPDETWEGTDLTFVGFGITSDFSDDAGTKRETKITVTDSDDQFIYSFSPSTNVCSGDSGGAALEKTKDGFEVAGINAYVEGGCAGGSNGATNVAAFLDFVTEFVTPNFEPPAPDLGGEGGLGLGVARGLDARPLGGERAGSGAQLACATGPGDPGRLAWLGLVFALGLRRRGMSL
jgi:secreted trypsin-like serine protease